MAGTLSFTSDSKISEFNVTGIREIAALRVTGGMKGASLKLADTEHVGTFEISSYNLGTIDAPVLSRVDAIKFSYIYGINAMHLPALETVGTFSLSEHGSWDTSQARLANLDFFKSITTVDNVTISYCNKLTDFSAFSRLVSRLSPTTWSVSNCGYNPTYQDMVDGKYAKP